MDFPDLKLVAGLPNWRWNDDRWSNEQTQPEMRIRSQIFGHCLFGEGLDISQIREKLEDDEELESLLPVLGDIIIDMTRNGELYYVEGNSLGRFKWQERFIALLATAQPGYITVAVPRGVGTSHFARRLANERGWGLVTEDELNTSAALADLVELCVTNQRSGIVLDCRGMATDSLNEYNLRLKARLHAFFVIDLVQSCNTSVSVWIDIGNKTETGDDDDSLM